MIRSLPITLLATTWKWHLASADRLRLPQVCFGAELFAAGFCVTLAPCEVGTLIGPFGFDPL